VIIVVSEVSVLLLDEQRASTIVTVVIQRQCTSTDSEFKVKMEQNQYSLSGRMCTCKSVVTCNFLPSLSDLSVSAL
jgi:hypothetical protein